MTIPFVGAEVGKTSSDTYQYPFGYIFGELSYTDSTAVRQYYYGSSTSSATSDTYYIPSSLRSVTVTGGNILYGAFDNCSILTSVTISDGVTSIGSSAFSGCTSLTSIIIPDSVTSIEEAAFGGCDSLEKLTVASGNPVYHSAGNCIIETETGTLIQGCNNSVIPSDGSVTSIGSRAFSGCKSLTSVTIPDSVTSIGTWAFRGCTSLTSVTIGNGVTSIGWYAFSGCKSLTSVTIPDSVTSIGSQAFAGCTSLTSITIPDSVTSIERYAFQGTAWYDLQPDGVVYAGKVAYVYKGTMPSDTSIVLEEGTRGITDLAFLGCRGLTSITIPDSMTNIGPGAFSGCISLTSVTFTGTITQWNAITKGTGWNSGCRFRFVRCSDGTVSV